jgi:imidazolonepropionase-like amidohydrolase
MQSGNHAHDRGFVDVHVHITAPEAMHDFREAGIRAVRDAGLRTSAEAMQPCCRAMKGLAVVSSYWALYKRGGYGSRFGIPIDGKSELKAEIIRLKKAGADIIKVMASGIVSLKKPGSVTPGGFNQEELGVIVKEAAALGLDVMAHVNSEPAIIAAAEAGVRSVEHGFFMTERALDVMAKKGVCWTPTIGALVRAGEEVAGVQRFVSDLVGSHQLMLKRAYAMGIQLGIGTDCILPDPFYSEAYQAELSYFEAAGIPHDAVMTIARDDGARLLRITAEL